MALQFLNRDMQLPRSAEDIRQRISGGHDGWMMTDAERMALTAMLGELRPECAVEIGSYRGGSLGVIARFSKKVYSIDIDPWCQENCAAQFPNVEFITGYSKEILPVLLEQLGASDLPMEFVLIDANHSEEGVRRDIEMVIRYKPTRPLFIVMHDSFNPACRSGILKADWESSPYAHMVEADFVPGRLVTKEEGNSARQMWCGFALGIMLPEPRRGKVIIRENEYLMFRTARVISTHTYQTVWNPFYALPQLKAKLHSSLSETMRIHAPGLHKALKRIFSRS